MKKRTATSGFISTAVFDVGTHSNQRFKPIIEVLKYLHCNECGVVKNKKRSVLNAQIHRIVQSPSNHFVLLKV